MASPKKMRTIGVTFVPQFLSTSARYIHCSLLNMLLYSKSFEHQFGLGSFWWYNQTVDQLVSYRDYHHLVNELVKNYSARNGNRYFI